MSALVQQCLCRLTNRSAKSRLPLTSFTCIIDLRLQHGYVVLQYCLLWDGITNPYSNMNGCPAPSFSVNGNRRWSVLFGSDVEIGQAWTNTRTKKDQTLKLRHIWRTNNIEEWHIYLIYSNWISLTSLVHLYNSERRCWKYTGSLVEKDIDHTIYKKTTLKRNWNVLLNMHLGLIYGNGARNDYLEIWKRMVSELKRVWLYTFC